jgi:hypothetical protein
MKNNSGMSLVTALIVVVVIGFLGVVVASLSGTNTGGAVDRLSSMRAQFVAEGGLEKGIKGYTSDCVNYGGEANVALGGGQFTVEVFSTDFAGIALTSRKRIRSTGTSAGAVRVVEQVVSCASAPLLVGASGAITIGNNGVIYCAAGPADPCYQAAITANTCYCAKQSLGSGLVPAVTIPSSPYPPAPPGGCAPSGNVVWSAGTYYCGGSTGISIKNIAVTLAGPVTFYATGFAIKSASVNWGGNTANLMIMATTGVTLDTTSYLQGAVYCSNAAGTCAVSLGQSATFTGTVGANTVSIGQTGQIIYDSTAGTSTSVFPTVYGSNVQWRDYTAAAP